jgi:hypothetical protein
METLENDFLGAPLTHNENKYRINYDDVDVCIFITPVQAPQP